MVELVLQQAKYSELFMLLLAMEHVLWLEVMQIRTTDLLITNEELNELG